jgi:dihydroxyacetone kinase
LGIDEIPYWQTCHEVVISEGSLEKAGLYKGDIRTFLSVVQKMTGRGRTVDCVAFGDDAAVPRLTVSS